MLGEKEIKHIVFLSDNFERGSATTVMLSAYLDLDGTDPDAVDNAKTRIQSTDTTKMEQNAGWILQM